MEKGQKYLLFAIVNEIYLSIDNCGNSALLAEAEDALDGIKQIAQSGPYGEIEGRVQGWNTEGVPDIQIVARNKRKSFFIRTDNDGWFHLQVPPGTYNLKAISSAFKLVPYDLNEDKQQHLVVHRGGCVHLDFDAR